jgi:hypothetical protein
MMAFPGMIVGAAEDAGIKVPPDLENYETKDFPHWCVFTLMQLGTPMPYPACHYDNAKVIAKINDEDIVKISAVELIALGFQIGRSK